MRKNILELNKNEIRRFFLESESYCNVDLPEYIDFNKLLKSVSNFDRNGFNLKDAKYSQTSHVVYSNKDGKYEWRKFELIHPIIYVELVDLIVEKWLEIKNHFTLNIVDNIQSCPIYTKERKHKKQKKTQIYAYLESIEKESIKKSLEFNYMAKLDITNCYPSVYTHTISWALHTKRVAKDSIKKKTRYNSKNSLLGNDIDFLLQAMQSGQTNGIPQGSILMDFVAEIILCNIDKLLGDKLFDNGITEYFVLRYRDDYRIFTKSKDDNEKIIKILSDILMDFNFKLNTSKTEIGEDIVLMSVKKDKLDNIVYHFDKDHLVDVFMLKRLLLDILNISKIYPNSGFVLKMLQIFNKNGFYNKTKKWYMGEVDLIVTILLNVASSNPRCFSVVCVSIFNLLTKLDKKKKDYFSNIIYKNLLNINNIGYNEIWLQRSLYKIDNSKEYKDAVCKVVSGIKKDSIFGNHFVSSKKIQNVMNKNNFINRSKLENISKVPTADEINIFDNISG